MQWGDIHVIKRRDFIKSVLVSGGWLLFSTASIGAQEESAKWRPAYSVLEEEGKLVEKVREAYRIFEECELCPRECGVNRRDGEIGFCRAPVKPVVYSAHPHFGEETPLVGRYGSGTIFFSNCNLRCVFCQNWPISHKGEGKEIEESDLADMMLKLQQMGCHNINFVTPTHVMPNIVKAVRKAFMGGLRIPLVYNTSGYERLEMIKFLDGIVDIYMPDMKYTDSHQAAKYSAGAYDYPEMAKEAIIEMNRQVGQLHVDGRGLAQRGLIIRHLVMPNRVAGTEEFVKWVAQSLPKATYVNIMPQYRVEYEAFDYDEISRGITVKEFLDAMDWAKEHGLTNLDRKSVAVRDFYLKKGS